MTAFNNEHINYLEEEELLTFKEKTNQLMKDLQRGDFESALRCINEINQINDENLFKIIGKITRGLHTAISDLKLSAEAEDGSKNRAQSGLGYVIEMTAQAAKTTLDMTEKSRDALVKLNDNLAEESALLEQLESAAGKDAKLKDLVGQLKAMQERNARTVDGLNSNVMEITIAQNYQDLASQSITKSITNIRGVEASLIALTKHANLLKQISQFTTNPEKLGQMETEKLYQDLEKLEELPKESEHMDQNDVDDLLSSLGF